MSIIQSSLLNLVNAVTYYRNTRIDINGKYYWNVPIFMYVNIFQSHTGHVGAAQ